VRRMIALFPLSLSLGGCTATAQFTQLGWDRYKVTVPVARSQEATRKKAEDAAEKKCQTSHEYARLDNYIDALGTRGRYSQYFECLDTANLIE
jgi:hypothetical protein